MFTRRVCAVSAAPFRGRSSKKLVMHRTLADNPSEVFVVRFSPDGKLVATGCNDGAIRVRGLCVCACCMQLNPRGNDTWACVQVYNLKTGYVHNLNVGVHNFPTTALRFRPISAASKTKNVLLAVSECSLHTPRGRQLPG